MKSREVLALLRITRPTLTKYVKTGIIKATTMPNGQYDYDKKSVMALFNDGIPLNTYIYARVSTHKQKADLENQIELLKRFCFERGYSISEVFSDVASGISFDKRKDFFAMLDKIIDGSDFKFLFDNSPYVYCYTLLVRKFGTKIVALPLYFGCQSAIIELADVAI